LMGDYARLASDTYWQLPVRAFSPAARHRLATLDPARALAEPAAADHFRVAGSHDRVRVPTFNIGGWYDIFLQGTIDNYLAMCELGVPTKLMLGPWVHGANLNPIGERNFGLGAQLTFIDLTYDFLSLQLRWF